MNEITYDLIQRLSNERHKLWRLAGNGQATERDRERIQQITGKLDTLWDTYRREIAGDHRDIVIERGRNTRDAA